MSFIPIDKDIKDNKCLNNINKKFPVVKKVSDVFELSFEENGKLYIIENCDGYFFQYLSSDELEQLSQYFLDVANYIKNKNS